MAYMDATRANLDGVQLSSLVFNVFDETNLSRSLNIMPDMLNGEPLANYTGTDKITSSKAGCGAGTPKAIIKESAKLIEFKKFYIETTFCAKELVGKMMAKGMKPDSEPDEVGAVISGLVENAAQLDLLRYAYLGDTAILSTALNEGVAVGDYNLKDGFYKQVTAAVTAGTSKKIAWNDADPASVIRKAKRAQHFSVRKDSIFFCTSGYYQKLSALTIGDASKNVDAMKRLIDGVEVLYIDGVEIRELEEVSEYIASDFKTPFDFGFFTTIENLGAPLDRATINADSWKQSAETELWYLRAQYQGDFKVVNDSFMVFVGA